MSDKIYYRVLNLGKLKMFEIKFHFYGYKDKQSHFKYFKSFKNNFKGIIILKKNNMKEDLSVLLSEINYEEPVIFFEKSKKLYPKNFKYINEFDESDRMAVIKILAKDILYKFTETIKSKANSFSNTK